MAPTELVAAKGGRVELEKPHLELTTLPPAVWRAARDRYVERVGPWASERVARMRRGLKHPVYDFLFEYYSFRPAHLLRWTPGFGILLEGATPQDLDWSEFTATTAGLTLPMQAFPEHRLDYLGWAIHYLRLTGQREPALSCMGLHEWAMVYRAPEVRHAAVPFRLSRAETAAVVEAQPLRCSHYDAFRFFTPEAVPRNRWELRRATTVDHDQPGCLHVNMDLYRFAFKIAPFCPSDLVADGFELARAAREIDMRASPYDLQSYGFPPVKIETAEGRAEYADLQRALYERGQPVRGRLLAIYEKLYEQRMRLVKRP